MKANTNEMRNIASEISSIAVEYQTKISQMYTKFANMPIETKEWTGNKAQEYVKYVLLDKSDLMAIGDQIKAFAKVIVDDANLLDNTASKVRKDESSG